jgi:hypothetical protein
MDWTTFDGYPIYPPRPYVDHRQELIRSLKWTAAFFVVLVAAAITIGARMKHGPTEPMPEPMSAVVCLD